MKYLLIKNQGEVEAEAFNLLGASTKANDDTKIGMFGSGTKYAIAFLMRNNIDFKIYSGEREIVFSKEETTMRGQVFNRIVVDGKPTSLTTSMGKDWKCWMALRELYCNAIDEVVYEKQIVDSIKEEGGFTSVFIEITPEVKGVLSNWTEYFSEERESIFQQGDVKLYSPNKNFILYRKGIRCSFEPDQNPIFHYDLPNVEINESRVVVSGFEQKYEITQFLLKEATQEIIQRLIEQIKGSYEENLLWNNFTPNNNWALVIGDTPIVEIESEGHYESLLHQQRYYALPSALCRSLLNKFDSIKHIAGKAGGGGAKIKKITSMQDHMIQKAFDFFKECEYEITSPINICDFTNTNVIGRAMDGEIYLSDKAFNGMYQLVITLIEEQEHINTGFEDETREFQTHFMELFLNEKMKRFSYVL